MTFYITNNPHIFKVNKVELPEDLVGPYRLTLDYQEDLDMFNALYKKLEQKGLEETTSNLFKILDQHPEISAINSKCQLSYQTDDTLIRLIQEKTRIP
jgi:spore coat polysaccharide biosynthesis protein SpsF (cytidylyltransferase family)